jgi:hypothetical protein
MSSRVRRVKCDEMKPSCKRCSSTGRRCDGYSDLTQPSPIGYLVVATGQARPECAQKSRASFQVYCEIFAPILSSIGTNKFWGAIVPATCSIHESIKHLVIATSTLGTLTFLDHAQRDIMFLVHYTKALRLLSDTREASVVVVLIGCILLAICDEIQQQRPGPSPHVLFGQKILTSYLNGSRSSYRHYPIDEIALVLSRLSAPRTFESIPRMLSRQPVRRLTDVLDAGPP